MSDKKYENGELRTVTINWRTLCRGDCIVVVETGLWEKTPWSFTKILTRDGVITLSNPPIKLETELV